MPEYYNFKIILNNPACLFIIYSESKIELIIT